jgi:hypothetical protein
MTNFLDSILSLAILAIALWGVATFFAALSKPPKRRRSNQRKRYSSYKSSYKPFTDKISDYQYFDNEAPGQFLVYFIENPKLGALKIGVGRAGRVNQLLNSHEERDENSAEIGWQILRVAVFSYGSDDYGKGREKANEAERRVKFYWKTQGLEPYLSDEQMGYSRMNIRNTGETVWVRTQGWSETIELGKACEVSSWKYVTNSPGYLGEFSSFQSGRELSLLNPEHAERLRPPNLSFPKKRSRTTDSALNQDSEVKHRPKSDGTQIGNFQARISLSEETECILWTGSVMKDNGYGVMLWNGELKTAHRVSWMIEFSDDLEDSHLLNQCGNRLCVNTSHWTKHSKSEHVCITPNCNELSETTYKQGQCTKCNQRAKLIRRAIREGRAVECPTPGCTNMSTSSARNSRCVECAAIARNS